MTEQITFPLEPSTIKGAGSLHDCSYLSLGQSPRDPLVIRNLMQQFWCQSRERGSLGCESSSTETHVEAPPILNQLRRKKRGVAYLFKSLFYSTQAEEPEVQLVSPGRFKEKSQQTILNHLKDKQGYPWDSIKEIPCASLMQQLIDIVYLSEEKYSSKASPVLDFSIQLVQLATDPDLNRRYLRSHELVKDAQNRLGQLIYLIDCDSENTYQILSSCSYQEALEQIKNSFNTSIEKLSAHLNHLYEEHETAGLQPANIVFHHRLPIEIAKILLTSRGTINVGLINPLAQAFLSHRNDALSYENNLKYTLDILKRSSKLRDKLEKIQGPLSSHMPMNDVIRATLQLSPDTIITDLHAKQVVLAALLSHPRQVASGSCFATSVIIDMMSSHLNICLKDLTQLVRESKLTRTIQGTQRDIPFLKRIADDTVDKSIVVDHQGRICHSPHSLTPLFQAPGIQAVCQALGLNDRQLIAESLVKRLNIPHDAPQKFKIGDLIRGLCEIKKETSEKEVPLSVLLSQALFAFSSLTASPLLKIWENAIAGMAEAQESGMIKSFILQSTFYAIESHLTELKYPPSPLIQAFLVEWQSKLNEAIQLRYDPAIPVLNEEGAAENIKEGGFVLYQNGLQRVDDSQGFKSFMETSLQKTIDILSEEVMEEKERQEFNKLCELFQSYVASDAFIKRLLIRYHPSNRHLKEIKEKELRFTPWLTRTGQDSKLVLEIYLEADAPLETLRIRPKKPCELLSKIIEIGKSISEEEKILYQKNPHRLFPVRVLNNHTCSLMLGHPSLAQAWQYDIPPEQWIQRFVIEPGQKIAQSKLDLETKQRLLQEIDSQVLTHFVSQDKKEILKKKQKFYKFVHKIKEDVSIQEYRAALVKICQELNPASPALTSILAQKIDTALCQSLPPKLKKQLAQSAVHFADTNWTTGIHDLHFCFAINPGTGELEVWQVSDNNHHFFAVNQKEWVFEQEWEFFSIPQYLAPDDLKEDSTSLVEEQGTEKLQF